MVVTTTADEALDEMLEPMDEALLERELSMDEPLEDREDSIEEIDEPVAVASAEPVYLC